MMTSEERRAEREMVMRLRNAKLQHEMALAQRRVMPLERMSADLGAFNSERARLLGNRPLAPGVRIPLPYTGIGGDIAENVG